MSQQRQSSLLQLPPDLIYNIIDYSSTQSLLSLSETCHAFRALLNPTFFREAILKRRLRFLDCTPLRLGDTPKTTAARLAKYRLCTRCDGVSAFLKKDMLYGGQKLCQGCMRAVRLGTHKTITISFDVEVQAGIGTKTIRWFRGLSQFTWGFLRGNKRRWFELGGAVEERTGQMLPIDVD